MEWLHFGKKIPSAPLHDPLKRSLSPKGPRKNVLLSERPTYPGSHLSEVFLPEKGIRKSKGPRKSVPHSGHPTFPRSHLMGVYCITKFFKDECELKITIKTNLKTVNFLDVTFDLIKESYQLYSKPNNQFWIISQSHQTKACIVHISLEHFIYFGFWWFSNIF